MRDISEVKSCVISYLRERHIGAKNVISSVELERVFGIRGVELRKIINELRCFGEPVCGNTHGYFYARNKVEVKHCINQLKSRANKILSAADGLTEYCGKINSKEKGGDRI